jgi:hypothetical protein
MPLTCSDIPKLILAILLPVGVSISNHAHKLDGYAAFLNYCIGTRQCHFTVRC